MKLFQEAIVVVLLGLSLITVPLAFITLVGGLLGRLADTDHLDNVIKGLVCCTLGFTPLGISIGLVYTTFASQAIARRDKPEPGR